MTTLETTQAQLTTVGVDTENSAQATAMAVAETSYQRLREAIGRYVTAAIQSGKLVVQEKVQPVPGSGGTMVTYGPVQFSHWHAHLPEEAKQHYNCRYCRSLWAGMSTLAVMDADGNLYYPVAAAFLECSDDPIVAKLFENYPEVREACCNADRRNIQVYPMDRLSEQFIEKEVGGFRHYFGVQDKDIIRLFNKDHQAFNDQMYIKGLFEQFISTEINLPLLAKLFQYIKKEIGEKDHTALGRADQLIEVIGSIRRAQNLSGRGYVYLWALLHKKENSWLQHVNGSVLGIVLDTAIDLKDKDNMEVALMQVKRLLQEATDGKNYKQKTAEAPVAALEQAFKFLEEKGMKGTMERRLFPLSEVETIAWREQAEVLAPVAQQPGAMAADDAFSKLMEKKDPDAQANKKMDELLGNVNVRKQMSLVAFIKNLDAYASLSFSPASSQLWPVMTTGAVTEGNHDELLNFAEGIGKYTTLLNTPRPYIYAAMAGLAGLNPIKPSPIGMFTPQVPADLPISAIYYAGKTDEDAAKRTYVANIEGFAANFQQTVREHGTCILGTAIRSEHFGMSRALVELSKQIPLNTDAGVGAAGGAILAPGAVINAVLKDGTRETITIASAE